MAVASSAGGVRALETLLATLDPDVPVPVLVVQHLSSEYPSALADILRRHTPLTVEFAAPGATARPGTVHLAPPDRHLRIDPGGTLAVVDGPPVHHLRPSADVLFASLAREYGRRAVACVLSGSGTDGADGVTAVKSNGGTVIVQDPRTAEFPGMPQAAVGTGAADFVLPLEDIAAEIRELVDNHDTKRQG